MLVDRNKTAEILGVCPMTVTRLADAGHLERVRIGRSVRVPDQRHRNDRGRRGEVVSDDQFTRLIVFVAFVAAFALGALPFGIGLMMTAIR